jgi:hypothetical protein
MPGFIDPATRKGWYKEVYGYQFWPENIFQIILPNFSLLRELLIS